MHLQPATIIKSTSALKHTFFENSRIIITAHNNSGSIGFVYNKLFNRPLQALQEFSHIKDFPLYNGGPVDGEHLFFIHRRPDIIEDGQEISEGIFYGGNFTQAVTAIHNYTLTENDIKIFIGYCGWDDGELEAELEEGSWETVDVIMNTIFNK
jgi:putative transcriptional regulator